MAADAGSEGRDGTRSGWTTVPFCGSSALLLSVDADVPSSYEDSNVSAECSPLAALRPLHSNGGGRRLRFPLEIFLGTFFFFFFFIFSDSQRRECKVGWRQ
jgi:hypothetical protein